VWGRDAEFLDNESIRRGVKYLEWLESCMAEKVPGWLERILLPQIGELKGEIRAIGGRFDGLEGKVDGLESKFDGEFAAVHSEINRLDSKIDSLDKRMDFSQRLAVVEEKVHELQTQK
jgi:hypothetical protein